MTNISRAAVDDGGAESSRARPAVALNKGIDRLEAIARGERLEAVVHKQVYEEQPVLEIENFSLWYGQKQALFDITMPVPKTIQRNSVYECVSAGSSFCETLRLKLHWRGATL